MTIATIAIQGCGSKESVVLKGPDGTEITSSKDGSSMTFKDQNGKTAQMSTDKEGNMEVTGADGQKMSIGAGLVSEADLGLPFYPGSEDAGKGMSNKVEAQGKKVVTCIRTSKDTPDKVLEFYQPKVMNPTQATADSGEVKSVTISGKLANGADVSIAASKDGSKDTQIMITTTQKS